MKTGRFLTKLQITEWVKIQTPGGEIRITKTDSDNVLIQAPLEYRIQTERMFNQQQKASSLSRSDDLEP